MSNDFPSYHVLNLQQRVACMENTIGFLTREVHRISQTHVSQGFQTTIPLQSIQQQQQHQQQGRRPYVPPQETSNPSRAVKYQEDNNNIITLSDILNQGEVVTFGIHTGRDASGGTTTSLLTAMFDGTTLTITGCESVPSLIGTQTSKPGEILFKFMHGLVHAKLLQRTFNALPWRLASVVRNGQTVTLAQLRRIKQETTQHNSL